MNCHLVLADGVAALGAPIKLREVLQVADAARAGAHTEKNAFKQLKVLNIVVLVHVLLIPSFYRESKRQWKPSHAMRSDVFTILPAVSLVANECNDVTLDETQLRISRTVMSVERLDLWPVRGVANVWKYKVKQYTSLCSSYPWTLW